MADMDTPLNQLPQSEIIADGLITHPRERLLHAMIAGGDDSVRRVVMDLYTIILCRRHMRGYDPQGQRYVYTNEEFRTDTQQLLASTEYHDLQDAEAKACIAWCIDSWQQYYGANDENQ
jgi:hypothetical protein